MMTVFRSYRSTTAPVIGVNTSEGNSAKNVINVYCEMLSLVWYDHTRIAKIAMSVPRRETSCDPKRYQNDKGNFCLEASPSRAPELDSESSLPVIARCVVCGGISSRGRVMLLNGRELKRLLTGYLLDYARYRSEMVGGEELTVGLRPRLGW